MREIGKEGLVEKFLKDDSMRKAQKDETRLEK